MAEPLFVSLSESSVLLLLKLTRNSRFIPSRYRFNVILNVQAHLRSKRGNSMQSEQTLSLIVPAFNEQDNIEPFYVRAKEAFSDSAIKLQIVFIDDGSTDNTYNMMTSVGESAKNDRDISVTALSLSRNFGKEAALYAGLKHATGDYCCFIDSDLQQRPETAREMLELLIGHPEYDIVAAYQEKRKGNPLTAHLSSWFYGLLGKTSGMDNLVADASDFRVFRREVAEALTEMSEYYRFTKGLFAWIGFKTLPFPYQADERHSGETSWSFFKLVKYALNGIMSFTTLPLRVATYLGLAASFAAIVYLVVVVLQRLILGVDVPGYATIVALLLFLGGIQLLVLGIIGEYLARVYIQGKNRPVFILRASHEFGRGNDTDDK